MNVCDESHEPSHSQLGFRYPQEIITTTLRLPWIHTLLLLSKCISSAVDAKKMNVTKNLSQVTEFDRMALPVFVWFTGHTYIHTYIRGGSLYIFSVGGDRGIYCIGLD